MAYTPAVLTFDAAKLNRVGASGYVDIIPNSPIIDPGDRIVLAGRLRVPLDDNGQMTVELPPTDDGLLLPETGRQYRIEVTLHSSGANIPALPAVELLAGETVDYTALVPVALTVAESSTYITPGEWADFVSRVAILEQRRGTTSVNGIEPVNGNVTLGAGDVSADPLGTAQNLADNLAAAITEGDAETLATANAYTDAHAPSGGGVTSYADLTDKPTIPTTAGQVGADPAGAATAAQAASLQKASNLADLADVSTARTNLGLGTAATSASSAFDAAGAASAAQTAAVAAAGTATATAIAAERSAPRVLTNARVEIRSESVATTSSYQLSIDNYDVGAITAQAGTLTIAAPGGVVSRMRRIFYSIKDDGTSRAITWNNIFKPIGVTLPASTTPGKFLYIGAVWNPEDSKWHVLAVRQEA